MAFDIMTTLALVLVIWKIIYDIATSRWTHKDELEAELDDVIDERIEMLNQSILIHELLAIEARMVGMLAVLKPTQGLEEEAKNIMDSLNKNIASRDKLSDEIENRLISLRLREAEIEKELLNI